MVLYVLRALFVLLMASVGWYFIGSPTQFLGDSTWLAMAIALTLGVLFVCVDILSPRRKLMIFAGSFFGLMVGIAIAYLLSFVVTLMVDRFSTPPAQRPEQTPDQYRAELMNYDRTRGERIDFINLLVGVTSCYLAISFILQTKDDFRFIIPFVEFSKQTKGARPILLDTSVLIDGRIGDITQTGILESQLIVPRFVLVELQQVADSADRLKRNRGRRGLDVLQKLQASSRTEVILYDSSGREREEDRDAGVDAKLVSLAKDLNGRVLTNDFNLNKVAQLRGVDVININDLANALKPVVLPGEKMTVRLVKPGEEPGQGVGYLEDGTMVVVEQARSHLNEDVEFTATSVLQTSAGKMIFGRLVTGGTQPPATAAPTPPAAGGPPSTPSPQPQSPHPNPRRQGNRRGEPAPQQPPAPTGRV
jgi:rRNA-processing protein FCF1